MKYSLNDTGTKICLSCKHLIINIFHMYIVPFVCHCYTPKQIKSLYNEKGMRRIKCCKLLIFNSKLIGLLSIRLADLLL